MLADSAIISASMPKVLLDWFYVAVFAVVGTLMAVLPLAVVWVLAPRQESPQKNITYESGVLPFGQAWAQFNVRYYLFALIFVVFDVEVIYLYPWAVVFRQLGPVAFVEMLAFLSILLIGLVYAWRKGALEWV
jgi:NAD(P)H-quinone oxidoreductase subunit 3